MKKLVSIAVLSIFLFNLCGFFLVFKYQQSVVRKEIKKQIKEGVPEDELTIIKQTSENIDELVWIKPHKEFTHKGTMYDVVRKTIDNSGNITYHCINDIQETTLFVHLDEQVRKTMDTKNNGKDPLQNLFLSLYFSDCFVRLDFKIHSTKIEINSEYSSLYFSPELNVSGPPPKFS